MCTFVFVAGKIASPGNALQKYETKKKVGSG